MNLINYVDTKQEQKVVKNFMTKTVNFVQGVMQKLLPKLQIKKMSNIRYHSFDRGEFCILCK